jgi:hypothetical protein
MNIYLGSDAEILEEPLVGAPELTPHGLLHLLVGLDQLSRLLEPDKQRVEHLSRIYWSPVEQHILDTNIHLNFDQQMPLGKGKCWYSNNCLHSLKCAVPSCDQTHLQI